MSVQDLTNAIINGINAGGEQFLEGTLAAVLPIVWLAILGLHLGRPYILDMIDRFTLRLGADLLWLVYVALRDLVASGNLGQPIAAMGEIRWNRSRRSAQIARKVAMRIAATRNRNPSDSGVT